jgi:hypothetical protein
MDDEVGAMEERLGILQAAACAEDIDLPKESHPPGIRGTIEPIPHHLPLIMRVHTDLSKGKRNDPVEDPFDHGPAEDREKGFRNMRCDRPETLAQTRREDKDPEVPH